MLIFILDSRSNLYPGGAAVVVGPGGATVVVTGGGGATVAVVVTGPGAFVVVVTGGGGPPDPEQRSVPSSVTFSTLGKLANAIMKSIFALFPADCGPFHPRFSKEQTFPEICEFEPSQTVKLVTDEENVISIFQDDTVFGKVM